MGSGTIEANLTRFLRTAAMLLGTGAFAARDAIYALRRTINGWRNPKTKANQVKPGTDEAAE